MQLVYETRTRYGSQLLSPSLFESITCTREKQLIQEPTLEMQENISMKAYY